MSNSLLLKPHISEKSFGSAEKGVYVFSVPLTSNKQVIKTSVENQFKVTVVDVKTSVLKGKPKRVVRKRQRPTVSHRTDIKKAYVTLKKGDKIAMIAEGAA